MANTKKYVSFDKLSLYDEKIKGVITAGDAATLTSANAYADSLASNYDAAGSAATVQGKLDTEIERAKAAEAANAAAAKQAQDEVDALELVVKNIQENAYDDTALRGEINAALALKADKTQVATDIETAVNAEKSARETAVAGVQSAVDTLSGTHATDKAALEAAIALKADQTALEAVSAVANAAVKQSDYDVKVKALEDEDVRIAGLVASEAERAADVEAGLESRIEDMEAFWAAAKADGDEGNVIDTLKEIQEYIASDETGASEMLAAINKNKDDIAAHVATNHDFAAADATLKTEIMTEVNKKADTTVVDGINTRLTTAEGEIDDLQGRMTTAEGEIDALQALFGDGDGSVADMIADAVAVETANRETAVTEAIATAAGDATEKANKALEDAKKYADEEDAKIESRVGALETASATHALASDLSALDARVTTAEGEIDTLQSEMDAVEALAAANKAAHEANAAAIALKAAQTDLEAVSGRVTALETWHNNFTEVSEEEINSLFTA